MYVATLYDLCSTNNCKVIIALTISFTLSSHLYIYTLNVMHVLYDSDIVIMQLLYAVSFHTLILPITNIFYNSKSSINIII